jgi:hypothetical protein
MEKELTGEEKNWGLRAHFSNSTGNTHNLPILFTENGQETTKSCLLHCAERTQLDINPI